MERTTRTNTFESTSARSEQQQENKLSVHDVPTETFAYNSQLLGLSNDSAPAQMKANPEEEQVQMKPEEELQMKPKEEGLQMKPEEEELQMKPEEEEMQMKREDDENKTQLKKGAVGLATAGGATKTAMPEAVQAKMENSFGTDFSNVTIHKDSGSATQMGAQAYAQGNDVHFAPGKYNPNTQGGQELLGHELTHVVQQRQGRVNGTQNKGGANVNSDSTLENEADVMGAKAAKGEPAKVNGKGSGVQMYKSKGAITGEISVHDQGKKPLEDEKRNEIYNYAVNSKVISASVDEWKIILSQGDSKYGPIIFAFLMAITENSFVKADAKTFVELVNPYFSRYGANIKTEINAKYDKSGASDSPLSGSLGVWAADSIGEQYSRELIRNFKNSIQGVPEEKTDIMNFMTALYTMKGKLELPSFDFSDAFFDSSSLLSKVMRDITRDKLAKAVPKYQSQLIANKSMTEGDLFFDHKSLVDLSEKGNSAMRESMIVNATATAYKALDFIVEGRTKKSDSIKEKGFAMVRNSGYIIKDVLKGHENLSKQAEGMIGKVFDEVWDKIPGGNIILGSAKKYLKDSASNGIKKLLVKDLEVKGKLDAFRLEYLNAAYKVLDSDTATLTANTLELTSGL